MDINVSNDSQDLLPAIQYLRIKPTEYDALLFTFLAFAIIAATARTGFRIWRFRCVEVDDILLVLSTSCLSGGVAVAHQARDLTYLQMSLSLGFVQRPPPDLGQRMATFQELDVIGGVLTWLSIFIVKLSFLAFFKKLIKRVRYLNAFWWIALTTVIAGLCVNVGLGFLICPHFGADIVQICTVSGMTQREGIYLIVSSTMDIVTDIFVICVPISLLWKAKIDLRRKLALGTVCSLSTVMIVLAIVRVALAPIQSPVPSEIPRATDSIWVFALQTIEGAVAIVMVSITAFRSMLGMKGQTRPTDGTVGTMGTIGTVRTVWTVETEEDSLEKHLHRDSGRYHLTSSWSSTCPSTLGDQRDVEKIQTSKVHTLQGRYFVPQRESSDEEGQEQRRVLSPRGFV